MLSPVPPDRFRQEADETEPLAVRRTRALNDVLRMTGVGGIVVESLEVQALPDETQALVFRAIQEFDDFNSDNDPWGEHDCATVGVDGQDYLFKIDYFDQNLTYHSPNKSDPTVTARVMTICTPMER